MSKHGILATSVHYRANMVLLKNLLRWRADNIRPYELNRRERSEHYALGALRYVCVGVVLRAANQNQMIAWGDHTIIQRIVSARLFPRWGNNVGALRRQWHHRTFCNEIRWCFVETWHFGNIVTFTGQIGSAQKFATLAGGYYPLYYGVIAPGDHWILIRCAAHHPTRSVPPNYRCKY